MKIAVSIPSDVFENAERFAASCGKPRSRLYSDALREYVVRHDPDQVAEAMNRVCDTLGRATADAFTDHAARGILESSEW